MLQVRQYTLRVVDPFVEDLPNTSELNLLQNHGKKTIKTIGQFAATDIPGLFASVLSRLHPSPQLKIVVNGIVLVPNRPDGDPKISHIDTLDVYYKGEKAVGFYWNFSWLYELAELFHRSQVVYHFTHYTEANGQGKLALGTLDFCINGACKLKGKAHSLANDGSNDQIDKKNASKVAERSDEPLDDMEVNESHHAHPSGLKREFVKYKNLVHCEIMGDTFDGISAPWQKMKIKISPVKPHKLMNKIGFRPCIKTGPDIVFIGRYYWPKEGRVIPEPQRMLKLNQPSSLLPSSHEIPPPPDDPLSSDSS